LVGASYGKVGLQYRGAAGSSLGLAASVPFNGLGRVRYSPHGLSAGSGSLEAPGKPSDIRSSATIVPSSP